MADITLPAPAPVQQPDPTAFAKESQDYINNAQSPFLKNPSLTGNYPSELTVPNPYSGRQSMNNIVNEFRNVGQWAPTDPMAPSAIKGFDPAQSNYDRFANSSNFSKLGFNPLLDNEQRFHDAQSTWQRAGDSLAQGVIKTAGYALQNLGFLAGAPAAIATGDITNMNDNFLVKANDAIKEYAQDKFPIFKGSQYTTGNIWDKLASSDWWLDDAMDRVALTAGMFLPALLGGAGLSLFGMEGEGAGAAAKGVASMAAAQTAGKAVTAASYNLMRNTFLPKLISAFLGEGGAGLLSDYASQLHYAELMSWNIIGQSGLNSKETQDGIIKALKEGRDKGENQLSDEEIQQRGKAGARNAFWETVPLTFAGSLLEVPMMYALGSGGKVILSDLYKGLKAGDLPEAIASSAPRLGKLSLRAALTALEHSHNESMQVAISRYNEDANTIDPKTGQAKDPRGTIPGIFGDFLDNYSNPNGQNNLALGFIQGAIMTLGGHGIALGRGQYKAQDEAVKQYVENVNQSRLYQGMYTGALLRDPSNGLIVDPTTGKATPNQLAIADGGAALYGLQRDLAIKQFAAQRAAMGDPTALDHSNYIDHRRLASFSAPYFDDPHGMEYLSGWFGVEMQNQKQDQNYEAKNGITPEAQYTKIMDNVRELKKLYDLEKGNKRFNLQDLEIDPDDKDKLMFGARFTASQRAAQYGEAASQMYFNNTLKEVSSGISAMQADQAFFKATDLGIDKDGKPLYKPFANPSTPQEVGFNDLLARKEPLEKSLVESRQSYKNLLSKSTFKKAFESEYENYRQDIAKDTEQKAAAERAKAQAAAEQAPVTPAPVPAAEVPGKPKDNNPILPQYRGELVYSTPTTGKTDLAAKYPEYVTDGDKILYDMLVEKGIPVTSPQDSGSALGSYIKRYTAKKKELVAEYEKRVLDEMNDGKGKTVVTGSKYLRDLVGRAGGFVFLNKDVDRIAQGFINRGDNPEDALKSAARVILDESKELQDSRPDIDSLSKRYAYLEHALTGIFPEVPKIEMESAKSVMDKVRDWKGLEQAKEDLLEGIADGKYDYKEVEKLIADKRKELVRPPAFEDIKQGDVLVMRDRTRYWAMGLAQVTGKDDNAIYVEPWNVKTESILGAGAYKIPASEINSQVEYPYSLGMTDEDIAPLITPEVEAVGRENLKNSDELSKNGADKAELDRLMNNPDQINLDETPC